MDVRTLVLLLALAAVPATALADDALERDVFERSRTRWLDAGPEVLVSKDRRYAEDLGFDPTRAKYFDRAEVHLKPTAEELAFFRKNGFVPIDHAQRYGFGSAYAGIYASDLPVLVTTDSILHAVHATFDTMLQDLEEASFLPAMEEALAKAHARLARDGGRTPADQDADLYLTVARTLLGGKPVKSALGQDEAAAAILAKVKKKELEVPGGGGTSIYGSSRLVDWSQFAPRGHYTRSEGLSRYFMGMMWLGRADLGFETKDARELAAAQRLARVVKDSGAEKPLSEVSAAIDFFMGSSEGHPPILSQVLGSDPSDSQRVEVPPVFQLFGQRFVIDSLVLSQVVYDRILYKGVKVRRLFPSGLDALYALGNDSAAELLAPELERFPYAGSLKASREYLDLHPKSWWASSVYGMRLDLLRALNEDHFADPYFPRAMKTRAWQRKQLETELASWAELRHDAILYAQQSYTAFVTCEYPAGYVEPYPRFFEGVRALMRTAAEKLTAMRASARGRDVAQRYAAFARGFEATAAKLQGLAEKELAGRPFSAEEDAWIKTTLRVDNGGCGGPTYSGWYTSLFPGGGEQAEKVDPIVADVHTDPNSGQALEVGTGWTRFLVVAVDNGKDRMVFVGPTHTYYEARHPASDRLTDEKWVEMLESGKAPARPSWLLAPNPSPVKRDLRPTAR